MGTSASTTKGRGFGGVANQLSHLRLRSADYVIAMGLMQQITSACQRSEEDRLTFFKIVVEDDYSDDGGYVPLVDLFTKSKVITDANLKAMIVVWMKMLLNTNEQVATTTLVKTGCVNFIVELYAYQVRNHLPLDTMSTMAALIARMATYTEFVDAIIAADALRPILQRTKYTMPGIERHNLIEALFVASSVEGGVEALARNETYEMLLKCMLDRAEGSNDVVCKCAKILSDIVEFRHEFTVTVKQLIGVLKLFERGPTLFPELSRYFCVLINTDPTQGRLEAELQKHFHLVFDTSFIDHHGIAPQHMLQLAQLALRSEKDVKRFVQSSQQFARVSMRMQEHIDNPVVVDQYLRLLRMLIDYDNVIQQVAERGALEFLLMAVEMCKAESYRAVKLMTRMCKLDTVSKVLLQQRRFHALLRHISADGTEEQTLTALEAMKILQSVFTPSVLEHTDDFQVDALVSLLCQALAQCPLPQPRPLYLFEDDTEDDEFGVETVSEEGSMKTPRTKKRREPEKPPTEQILEIVLALLAWRSEDKKSAATILAQAPLNHLRLLINQTVSLSIAHTAATLRDNIAKSSPEAAEELRFYGCAAQDALLAFSVLAFQSTKKITLPMLQRHWRTVYRSRAASRFRSKVATLYKDFFLIHTDFLEEERQEFKKIEANVSSRISQITKDYKQRLELEEDATADLQSLELPQQEDRDEIALMFCEGIEDIKRLTEVEQVEQRQRGFFPFLANTSLSEVAERQREIIIQQNEFGSILSRHAVRIRAIDRLYEHRQALALQETEDRENLLIDERYAYARYSRLFAMYAIQVVEHDERRTIFNDRSHQLKVMLRDMYPVLIGETLQDEETVRNEILADASAVQTLAEELFQLYAIEHAEDLRRREHELWQLRISCTLFSRFYRLVTNETVADEQRGRAAIIRDSIRGWKALAVQWPRLHLEVEEQTGRQVVTQRFRLEFNMIMECWRYARPHICEVEESGARAAIIGEYNKTCQEHLFVLRSFKIAHEELVTRNAIALQHHFTARNLILPFYVLRLHLHSHKLLLDDLDQRASLWVREDYEFYMIQQAALQQRQKIERHAVMREQTVGQEELAKHFLSVTHVMKIRMEAQRFLRNHPVL